MKLPFLSLLMLTRIVLAKELIYRNHTCLPSGYSKLCILENPHYDPKAKHVIHSFPANQSHVRIISTSQVSAKLYVLLGQPAVLEVQQNRIWQFELPRALRQGIFRNTYIPNFTVEAGMEAPKVIYLDLSHTSLMDIANISSLENLEVLLLRYNYIKTINPDTMKNLSRLRILDVSFNYINKLSLAIFPKSLTNLNLFNTGTQNLNFNQVHYPSLKVLNIEQNFLTSIDASAVMQAMPSLTMIRLGSNNFERDELQQALGLFSKHNISFRDEADEAACIYNEQILEGVCFEDPSIPRGVLRDILLSFAVVLVALAFVATLRWVFLAMRVKVLAR